MHLSPFHFLVFTKINTTLLIALNIPRNVGIHQIIQPSAVILLETNTARNAAWPTIITSRDESHPSVLLGHWSRSRFFFFQSMLKLFLQSCSTDRSNTSLARNPGWTLFFRSLPLCWFLTVCCVSFARARRAWVMVEFTVHRRCLVLSLTTPSDSHHVDLLIWRGSTPKIKVFFL